jgi:hypothetical protein
LRSQRVPLEGSQLGCLVWRGPSYGQRRQNEPGTNRGARLQVDRRGDPACGDGRDRDPNAALGRRQPPLQDKRIYSTDFNPRHDALV